MNPELTDISRLDSINRGFPNQRIPRFQEGGTKPMIFSASDMNVLVDAVNRLLAMEIQLGNSDMIIHTDSKVIIQIANPPPPGELSAVTAT